MKITVADNLCSIEADPGETLASCEPENVVTCLTRCGAVFLSGFEPTLEGFESFTNRFGTCAETRVVHYPPGGAALGFHAEDAYNPFRPDALWLWCACAGRDGGAPTNVVDGVRLLKSMSEEWQLFSRANQLRFERVWSGETWQKIPGPDGAVEIERVLRSVPGIGYQVFEDGTLYVRYDAPFVTRTPAGDESFSNTMLQALTEPAFYGMSVAVDGSPVPNALVSMVRELALEQEVAVGGSSGDVVLIDNSRMMHRRGEYHEVGRDMRARHCENFYGSALWDATSPLAAWTKRLLQGDEAYPDRVGPFDSEANPFSLHCRVGALHRSVGADG